MLKNKTSYEEEMTWTQEIEISADKLVDRVKELIEEDSVRHLIIRNEDGQLLLEVPLTAGVTVGTLMTILAPTLVALSTLAVVVTNIRLEIVRVEDNQWGND